jgi:tRNA A-37 threonylcarbamoyl transferase component Bud32/tetratricopeptide (TPR) repeat protein
VAVDAEHSDSENLDDPLIGRVIADRYRVRAPLGRGGMGAVYRVEHLMLKKELALKFLHPELGRLDEVSRRFEREAEAAAKLDHPNIVAVTDFGRTADGMLFLVMELLAGRSLTDVIRPDAEGRPLSVERALHIERQILRALDHAHSVGIVHRDLKPDNVMLVEREGDRDFVKLLDFGIAKMTAPDGETRGDALTQAGVVFGTPEYLSPEQAMGEEADRRADLYSAGIVLYEMLTGRRPFEAASKVAIVSMHLTQKAMPVTQAAPGAHIPRAVERVVERAMAKKRDERYATAQEFLQAMEGAGGTSQPFATATRTPSLGMTASHAAEAVGGRATAWWHWLVRRATEVGVPWPRAFVGAGFALVLVLVLLLALSRRGGQAPRPSPPAVATDLLHAETLLGHGELESARAALTQLLSKHPEVARVHYLLGNLDFAQGERDRAIEDYRAAIHRDPGYGSDAALRSNVRALLDRRNEGPAAVALLVEDVGKPALPDLAACAKACRDAVVRRRAADAVVKLGGGGLLPADQRAEAEDPHSEAVDKLRSGKSCRERKVAALELIASGDKRYADSLRAARERRGGFFGLDQINGCMRRDLDAALRKWDAAEKEK